MREFFKKRILAAGGVLCLVFAGVWAIWIGPWLTRLPADFQMEANVLSTDDFYDEARDAFSGEQTSVTSFSYRADGWDGEALRISNRFDVRTVTGDPIFSVERVYGIDPVTGTHVSGAGDRDRTGYLFGPRFLRRGEPFTYWHANYDGPARMTYAGEEDLYGLHVYRYETRYEGVRIDQSENLTNLPGVPDERRVVLEPYLQIWIEPVSGRLVRYSDDTVAYFEDAKTGERLHPWNHFSNSFTEDSIQLAVTAARAAKGRILLQERSLPGLVAIVGLVLLWMGLGLGAWARPRIPISVLCHAIPLALIVVGGAVFVFGWLFRLTVFINVFPNSSGMNPLTALSFVVLGFGLFARKHMHDRAARLSGIALCAIALARLANIVGILPLQVDQILFLNVQRGLPVLSRMAPFTSVCFLLSGVALLTYARASARLRAFSRFASSILLSLALLALSGFLFSAVDLLVFPFFLSTALHTAALFLLAGFFLIGEGERAANAHEPFRRRFILPIALSIPFFMTLLTVSYFTLVLQQRAADRFNVATERVEGEVVQRMELYVNALEGGRGLFESSVSVERDEWRTYVTALNLQRNYPGIQGMGYAVFIHPEALASHEASVRASGVPGYAVYPPGPRDLYSSIVYLEPMDERNRRAIGYDMFSEPVRHLAMSLARDSGKPWMSGRVTLVQEISEDVQAGFVVYLPLYRTGWPLTTPEERRRAIIGYVYSPFRMDDLMRGIFGAELPDIHLEIFDGIWTSAEDRLYTDSADDSETSQFVKTKTVFIVNHPWTFVFKEHPSFHAATIEDRLPVILLWIGFAMSILLAFLFHVLFSSRERALAIADEATKGLKESKRDVQNFLDGLATLAVKVDVNGRVMAANRAAEQSVSGARSIVGSNFFLLSWFAADARLRARAKRAFETALKGSSVTRDESIRVMQDGAARRIAVRLALLPVMEGGAVRSVIAECADITEHKRAEEALRKKSDELERANRLMVGRELKMVELKKEIRALKGERDGTSEADQLLTS